MRRVEHVCAIGRSGAAMNAVLAGAIAMALAVAGLFFYRFWRKTNDRIFALFSLSFFVLAVNRVAGVFLGQSHGDYLFWVRLLAFTIILVAVIDKNRSTKPS
jgi:hypothetical protein